VIIWNHIGFFLDDLLYPDWNHQIIHCPLFIVGNPRSGTTLFHRLLSQNEMVFTSMKLWEILFAASVTWRALFHYLYFLDSTYFFSIANKIIRYFDECVFRNSTLHRSGMFYYEEDEWVIIHIFCSQLILLFYPSGMKIPTSLSILSSLPDFESLPSKQRIMIFSFYKDCVKRHLYGHELLSLHSHHQRPLIYVSKNPTFTVRLKSLRNTFQNLRIVCMIRNPKQSVPSTISYISKVKPKY
jgi:hypothetical protein